jgi:hypothetical protein
MVMAGAPAAELAQRIAAKLDFDRSRAAERLEWSSGHGLAKQYVAVSVCSEIPCLPAGTAAKWSAESRLLRAKSQKLHFLGKEAVPRPRETRRPDLDAVYESVTLTKVGIAGRLHNECGSARPRRFRKPGRETP